jgi:hypothetical protein
MPVCPNEIADKRNTAKRMMKFIFTIEVTPEMKYYEPQAHQPLAEKVTSRVKS